jgi:hypothetical protein
MLRRSGPRLVRFSPTLFGLWFGAVLTLAVLMLLAYVAA